MTDSVTRRRGDTRERIQRVALERFTTNGYDQTSLREIAEDLGVTKAALYHHFKSKEEILDALLDDVAAELKSIVSWMEEGPPTRERRLEAIRRLGELTRGAPGGVIRCVQQNEVALQKLGSTTEMVHEIKRKLWQSAMPADASVEAKLRMRMAVMTVLIATRLDGELGGTANDRTEAAQAIAADLVP